MRVRVLTLPYFKGFSPETERGMETKMGSFANFREWVVGGGCALPRNPIKNIIYSNTETVLPGVYVNTPTCQPPNRQDYVFGYFSHIEGGGGGNNAFGM